VFKEAGVPDGVINVVLEPGMITDTVWQVVILRESTLQDRLTLKIFGLKLELTSITIKHTRIVGETGGKDFIIAHSTNPKQVSTELFVVLLSSKDKMFSSFTSLCTTKWPAVKQIITDVKSMKMGSLKTLVISLLQ
jgi:hypothetical protein